MNRLRLALLGAPIVHRGEQIATFRTRKALALLIYLAVEGNVHARDNLAALFWPESDQSKGRAALRSTLAYLRQALAGDETLLIIERDALSFNHAAGVMGDWLTLRAAWQAARQPLSTADATATLPSRLAQLQNAASLYRADFLAGFSLEDAPEFDDWASTQREICHRQISLILDRLSQLQVEGGTLPPAIETTARWISLDPLNESAHRRLMQLHFAAEDRSAALVAYENCRAILARELNATPAPETEALADRIRAGEERSREAGGPAPAPPRPPAAFLPLVGRADQHLALVSAYRTMRRGQPHLVSLEGEPGIGKSRLAQEFLGWALAQGADILQGQAFEAGRRLPYQAIVEALRDRLDRENAPDDLLSDLWLAELSQLLPELRERYPDLPAPSAQLGPAQAHLFEAVTRLGQALAQRAPLLFFVDDLQWVDAASLDLLQYAIRRWSAAGEPVLLIVTVRSEALEPAGSGLAQWLLTLQREITLTRLALTPLSLADIQALLQMMGPVQSENSDPAPAGFLAQFSQRLLADTGGQPFFLVETLKMLFEAAPLSTPAPEPAGLDLSEIAGRYLQADHRLEMPPSVQDMIKTRLSRLTPAGQTACLAAAVLGDSFDFERLYQVAGLSEREGLEALEELLGRGLLREQRQAVLRPYVLAHDRFREVICNQAGLARQRILHRRAFAVLVAGKTPPAELARHALAGGLWAPAFEWSLTAGEEAMRLYAPQAAIAHFNQALEAAQPAGVDPPLRLYRARGQAYETVGDFDRALADFQQALQLARSEAEPHQEWHALQELGRLWASHDYTQAGHYFQQGLSLARHSGEPATLARSLNRIGNWQANIEQPFSALKHHQEALAIFESLADRRGQAETLDFLGMASFMAGDVVQSCAYYERAVELFRELDHRTGLVSSLPMLALVMRNILSLGVPAERDVTQCVPIVEAAVQLAREIEWRAGECNALLALGLTYAFQGDYGQGLAQLNQALTLAEEIKHWLWLAYAHWALGVIHMDLLALPQAQHHFERASALAAETSSLFWQHAASALLAGVYGWQNAGDQAERVIDAVLGPAEERLDTVEWAKLTTMQRLLWFARIGLALARQQPQLALEITDCLIATTVNLTPQRAAYRLFTLRGQALLALGRPAEAETTLRQALLAAKQQREPMMVWRIHYTLGQVYQTEGRPAEAQAELAEAEAIIEQLAVTVPEGALRENFRRIATGRRKQQ